MEPTYDAVTTLSDTTVPGLYLGEIAPGWTIGKAVNGGVVMAIAATAWTRRLRADGDTTHPDLVSFSGSFLTGSAPGPVRVSTEILRVGRALATGQVSVTQDDQDGTPVERMRALVSNGGYDDPTPLRQPSPPAMPPPDACVSAADAPPSSLSQSELLQRLDLRLDPACVGWAMGSPSGRGEARGWFRLADFRDPDSVMLLLALDGLPPVAFDLGIPGWAPTLEFTAYVYGHPAPGWLQLRVTTSVLAGGRMEEDALVWDSTGRLVAQSRQLCGVRVPQGWTPPA